MIGIPDVIMLAPYLVDEVHVADASGVVLVVEELDVAEMEDKGRHGPDGVDGRRGKVQHSQRRHHFVVLGSLRQRMGITNEIRITVNIVNVNTALGIITKNKRTIRIQKPPQAKRIVPLENLWWHQHHPYLKKRK